MRTTSQTMYIHKELKEKEKQKVTNRKELLKTNFKVGFRDGDRSKEERIYGVD